jgi:hypothetical protein
MALLSLTVAGGFLLGLSRCGLKKNPPLPAINTIAPTHGPSTGSTLVTISGSNIFSGATVSIGGDACTVQKIYPPNVLTCTTVPHPPGTTDVAVTNAGGSPGVLPQAFNYLITSWSFTVGNAGNGLNKISTLNAATPVLAEFNGKLYATWSESNGSVTQIRVAVYNADDNAPAWTFVDGGGTNGINHAATNAALQPTLAVASSQLYASWIELNGANHVVRVAVYNGKDSAPAWTFVDGASGINKVATADTAVPQLQEFNGKLYATWTETDITTPAAANVIRVAVYTPPSTWTFVDGNSASAGLNRVATTTASRSWLQVSNAQLYAAWVEGATTGEIRVAAYNGKDTAAAWTFVDGNALVNGINHNPALSAGYVSLAALGNKLYAVWLETNGTVNQIRAAVYNGNNTWSFVDGNGLNGLNHDPTKAAIYPRAAVLGSTLYVAWLEATGTVNNVRVSAYNGVDALPVWIAADGGGASGINRNPALDAQFPFLTPYNGNLYTTWSENNGSAIAQIWVAVGL